MAKCIGKYTTTRQQLQKSFSVKFKKHWQVFFINMHFKLKWMKNVKIMNKALHWRWFRFWEVFKLLFPSISRLMAIMSIAGILGFFRKIYSLLLVWFVNRILNENLWLFKIKSKAEVKNYLKKSFQQST